MAYDLGTATIADGVAQKEEYEACAAIGFLYGQGIYFDKAVLKKDNLLFNIRETEKYL